MTLNQIIDLIETTPLTQLKSNTYDCQLVESVRKDILKLNPTSML
jgi:hypothetical protein